MAFVCQRCGNEDERYLGRRKDGSLYCRLCLKFCGEKAPEFIYSGKNFGLKLLYPLSEKQEEVSEKAFKSIENGKPVLINAVTGAGKTELVYRCMEYVLNQKGAVGFATPRKDVVLELAPRIHEAFPMADVITVCEDHTEILNGDIIVLTSHQLYRYPKYFDLLVFDEIDAFPYSGNKMLRHFFRDSIKGTYILLSATPSESDIESLKKEGGLVIRLNERYHGKPLPVPEKNRYSSFPFFDIFRCLKSFIKKGKPCFVFAPTIEKGRMLALFLSMFLRGGTSVDSKDPQREKKISDFKSGKLNWLVCTSVLERGVTVKDLQVIVTDADNPVYSAAALIQIAGRAGRKTGYEDGRVVLFFKNESPAVKECVEKIKETNENAGL